MMSSSKQSGGHNVSRHELENRIRRFILEISRENDTSIRDDVAKYPVFSITGFFSGLALYRLTKCP